MESKQIRRVAVLGAGVMGSGIAAQIANAGVPVDLLDIVPKNATDRNVVAKSAIEKMLKTDPAPLMHKDRVKLIAPGNLEDDLSRLSGVDWVIEVVLEDLDVKRDLYAKIDQIRASHTIVSSNTSTIPLKLLTQGRSEGFCQHFLITHFFNPPRYMRLLELVKGEHTLPEAMEVIRQFVDVCLGKSVVECHDTPGFIANRIGTYWIQHGINAAFDLGLSVDEADAVISRPFGIPKTGVFGLVDLVGIDLMPHIGKSLLSVLSSDDPYREHYREPELIQSMIQQGYTGRKGKGGFYRLNIEGGKKIKESIDLKTGQYAPCVAPNLSSIQAGKQGPVAVLKCNDPGAAYAREVFGRTLHYAISLVPEIADDIVSVDQAMKWGYNWKWGPFELIDKIGLQVFSEIIVSMGLSVPPLLELACQKGGFYKLENEQLCFLTTGGSYKPIQRPLGVLLLEDIKRTSKPLIKNGSASLWDIGDGVVCLEFHTKMNALDSDVMSLIAKALPLVAEQYKAMVIYNEGSHFSAGANIGLALFAANVAMWSVVEDMISMGQQVYQSLQHAPFPVVGAPSGMALGGGCEILLHCDAVQAHAETYVGLVEVGVGVIPAWGGCKEMLKRWGHHPKFPKGPMPHVAKSFEIVSTATVAKSAFEAQDLCYFRHGDGITMNRDRLLYDAKAKALSMVEGYQAPQPATEIRLPGPSGRTALDMAVSDFARSGKATPHDQVVCGELAQVLSGGDVDIVDMVSEQDILKLEREAFMRLVKHPGTLARIEHMLETGKPLRN